MQQVDFVVTDEGRSQVVLTKAVWLQLPDRQRRRLKWVKYKEDPNCCRFETFTTQLCRRLQ